MFLLSLNEYTEPTLSLVAQILGNYIVFCQRLYFVMQTCMLQARALPRTLRLLCYGNSVTTRDP